MLPSDSEGVYRLSSERVSMLLLDSAVVNRLSQECVSMLLSDSDCRNSVSSEWESLSLSDSAGLHNTTESWTVGHIHRVFLTQHVLQARVGAGWFSMSCELVGLPLPHRAGWYDVQLILRVS